MHAPTRLRMTALNPHLACGLCKGYLVDATTIVECLHSFCKTCIVRYLSYNKCCPTCRVLVHKTKPLLNIREDKSLQDLVYKLVPNLFKDEMQRRRDFYKQHPHQAAIVNKEQRGEVADTSQTLTKNDENISLQIQLCDRLPPYNNGGCAANDKTEAVDTRYLNCPALFTVGHLKKFIRLKFDLSCNYKSEVFHSDEPLKDEYTLLDIAYIYNWRRDAPLKLFYIVFDKTVTDYQFYIPTPVMEAPIVSSESVPSTERKSDLAPPVNTEIGAMSPKKSSDEKRRKRTLSECASTANAQVSSSSEAVPTKKEKIPRTEPRIPKLKIRKVPKLHQTPSPHKGGKHKHMNKPHFSSMRVTDSPMEVVILPPSPDSSSDVPDFSRLQGSTDPKMQDIHEENGHESNDETSTGSSDSESEDSGMDTSSGSSDSPVDEQSETHPSPKVTPVKLKFTHKDNSLSCTPVDISIVPKDTSTPATNAKPPMKGKIHDKTLFEKLFGELSAGQSAGKSLLDSPGLSSQNNSELFMDPGTRSEGFNASAGSDSKEDSSLTLANESNTSQNTSQRDVKDIKTEVCDARVVVANDMDTKAGLIKIIKKDTTVGLEENGALVDGMKVDQTKPLIIKQEIVEDMNTCDSPNVAMDTLSENSKATSPVSNKTEPSQPLYNYLSSVMGQEKKSRPVAAWVRRKEEMNDIMPRESKLNLAIRKIKEKQIGKSPERPSSASSDSSVHNEPKTNGITTTVKATTWVPTAPGLLPPPSSTASSAKTTADLPKSSPSKSENLLSKVKIENGASKVVYATRGASCSPLANTEGVDVNRMSLLEQYCLKNVVQPTAKTSPSSDGTPKIVTNTSKPFSISELAPSEIIIDERKPSLVPPSSSLEKLKQLANYHGQPNGGPKPNDSILQICPTPVQGNLKVQTQGLSGLSTQVSRKHSCGKFVPFGGKDLGKKPHKDQPNVHPAMPAQLQSTGSRLGHHPSKLQMARTPDKALASLAAMYAGQQKAVAAAALRQQALNQAIHRGHVLPAQLPPNLRPPIRRNPTFGLKSPTATSASNKQQPARPTAKFPPRPTHPPQPNGKDFSIQGPRISPPFSMCSPYPYESYMYTSGGLVMVGSQMKGAHLPISQPYSPYARNSISTPSPTSLSPASPVSPGQAYRLQQQEIPEDLSMQNNGYDAPLDFSKKGPKRNGVGKPSTESKSDEASSGEKVLLKVPSLLRP